MIKRLHVIDFMSAGEEEFNFTRTVQDDAVEKVSSRVHITGGKDTGKTLVGDALVYALTGRDRFGDPLPTNLIKNGSKSLKTAIIFDDGSNLVTTMDRSTRKKTAIYNGKKVNGFNEISSYPRGISYPHSLPLACAIMAGTFMRLSLNDRWRTFLSIREKGEVRCEIQVVGKPFEVWSLIREGDIDAAMREYRNMDRNTQKTCDVLICLELWKRISKLKIQPFSKLIFRDDANLCCHAGEIIMPSDIQLFTTQRIDGTPFKIL